MDIKRDFTFSSIFPVPLLRDFFTNPYMFFPSTVHICILNFQKDNTGDIAFLPYTDEVGNASYYGKMDILENNERGIKYHLGTINFGEHLEITTGISLSRKAELTEINMSWEISSMTGLLNLANRKTGSLNPEHIVEKHIRPYLKDMESISLRLNGDDKYAFETVIIKPHEITQKIKSKSEEIENFIAVASSEKERIYIEVRDRKMERIEHHTGGLKKEGGEAILSIMNSREEFLLKFYYYDYKKVISFYRF